MESANSKQKDSPITLLGLPAAALLLIITLVACGGGGGASMSNGSPEAGFELAEDAPVVSGKPESKPDKPVDTPSSMTNLRWVEIPNSAMDTVYDEAIDCETFDFGNWPYASPACEKTWEHIQEGWSGGAVSGDWFYIHGGGHFGSPHNGVFRVDANGRWERVTQPSPLWTSDQCEEGLIEDGKIGWQCTTPRGNVCDLRKCTQMPDGQPASIHSYNNLASDGNYLYRVGGSWWYASNSDGPVAWRLDLKTKEWSVLPNSEGIGGGYGNLTYHDGKLLVSFHSTTSVYDIDSAKLVDTESPGTGQWRKSRASEVQEICGGYVYGIGQKRAHRTRVEHFPYGWENIAYSPVADDEGPGLGCYKDELWAWHGGNSFEVFDGGSWRIETPAGKGPGDEVRQGTYGRLFVLSGKLCLINGVHKNMYCLGDGGTTPGPSEPVGTVTTSAPTACTTYKNTTPYLEPETRGEDFGLHTIRVRPAIGPAHAPRYQSCADVPDGITCREVDPSVLDGYGRALDSLPSSGGVVLFQPGVHVLTKLPESNRSVFTLVHLQGIPDSCGNRPVIRGTLGFAEKNPDTGRYIPPKVDPSTGISVAARNVIIEGLDVQNFSGHCVLIPNDINGDVDRTVLVEDSFIHHCYSVGFSMGKGPHVDRVGRLYVQNSEMGYIWSGAHMLYLAGGRSFYTENSYYHSAGWHAFKVVAHNIAAINSVMSQVGLDGRPAPNVGAVNEGEKIGQGAAVSIVACQRGVFKGNNLIGYKGMAAARQKRKSINGCDFEGAYYPVPGEEPLKGPAAISYPDRPTEFWTQSYWDNVVVGGAVQDGNPHLLPIFWSNNNFTYLNDGANRFAVSNSSTWPILGNGDMIDPNDVPDGWIERSRDVFVNNTLDGYGSLYHCDSVNPDVQLSCRETVLVDLGGNEGDPSAPIPDWFITDPTKIDSELRRVTAEELYPTQ